MAKVGRPKGSGSRYTTSLSIEICAELAEGKPLRQICREKKLAWRTIYDWIEAHKEFAALFARSRDLGMDAIAEETLEIANTPLMGVIKTYKADGSVEAKEEDMLGHRKLQIDTRLKLLAKWNPKKWGDKVETTHRGDPTAPVALILNGSDVNG